MKKFITISLAFSILISLITFGQDSGILPEKNSKYRYPDSPVDNISYWMEMARDGIIPFNVSIPVKPAENIGSRIKGGPVDQMSTDICVWNETGVTQSENSVFIDPDNAEYLLNSNNSEQSGSIYGADYIISSNAAQTWTGSKQGAGGANNGDPAVCIGRNGRRYVGFITSAGGQGIAWSDDGTTWNPVTIATSTDLLDKNHMMIDNRTSGSYINYLYSAWTRFESGHANDMDIEISRSTNSGVTWSAPINISNAIAAGSHNQGVNVQTGPSGQVYAVWVVYDTWGPTNYFENALGFTKSTNGGSSFGAATRIHNNIHGIRPRPSTATTNVTGKNMRVFSFPSMTVDVSGGAYNGNIYVVWPNLGVPGVNTGTNVSVYCMRSTDGGTTWDTPVRVNQGTSAADYASFFAWITCDPATGKLYCIFYDDRNLGSTSTACEVWCAYSEDGGVTWSDFRVSDVSFTPAPIAGLATGYMGDYLGISARDGWVYPCWTDNRSGRALTYVSPLHFNEYCIATGGCDEYISNVAFGSIANATSCTGYADFTNLVNEVYIGSPETVTVTNGNAYSGDQCGIWVDWNRDGDFYDANETITVSGTPGGGPYTASISPPAGTLQGPATMRIRITFTGDVDPCGTTTYGEVEDYTVNVLKYCAASGGCDEYISNVQIGTINNTSDCNGYSDYSYLSTVLDISSTAALTITNGAPWTTDQCGVWVDWNHDNDFYDANETVSVTGTPGVGPYTATIDPPVGALSGPTGMRIRVMYTGTLSPCGITNYGEVEDYTLNIAGTNTWTGAVNTSWHNAGNWSAGHIPLSYEDVVIPNVGFQPVVVDNYNEECADLSVNTGATLNIYDQTLTVNGIMTINGTLGTLQDNAVINAMSNVVWNSGSQWNGTAYTAYINVYGDWNFESGSNVNPAQGFVDFEGTTDCWIRCYSSTSSFYIMRVYKSGGAAAKFSNLCSQNTVINGLTFINSGAILQSLSDYNIVMKGNFNYYGTFDFTLSDNTGSVVFDGTSQTINNYSSGSGIYNNVVFSASTSASLASGNLSIAKNLTIEQGNFSSGSVNITLGGNWTNSVGAPGYTPGTGTVTFHSAGSAQDVNGTNTFNNIIQDNTGQYLRFNGNTTIQGNLELYYFCWAYNTMNVNGILNIDDVNSKFTANGASANVAIATLNQGGSLVCNGTGAVITVNDLYENIITGKYYVNDPGGTMSLTNSGTGTFVDLAGELHNFGGTINISGSISYWPYTANAVVEMSGGIIDLKTCGLRISSNAYTLDDNITGGTIRTAYYFSGNRADFTPAAGTIELYGPTDSYIEETNGCTIYDLKINKSADESMAALPGGVIVDEHTGEIISDGGKANNINLSSNFTVTGDVIINAGSLTLNGYTLNAPSDFFVYGTLNMNNAADILNSGSVYFNWFEFSTSSTANLTAGTINLIGWIIPRAGSNFTATTGHTVVLKGNNGGGLSNFEPTAVYGNIIVDKNAGQIAYIDGLAEQPINVSGNFTMNANTIFEMQGESMHVYGVQTDIATSEIRVCDVAKEGLSLGYSSIKPSSDQNGISTAPALVEKGTKGGYLEIDTDLTINGKMIVNDGNVMLHGGLTVANTGILTITSGSFVSDKPYYAADAWQYLNGTINLSAGLFEIAHNSMRFSSTSVNNISGGIMRCGFTFYAADANVYKPTGGVTEFTGNDPLSYIYCTNGNWFNDFTVNKGSMIEIWSDITVKGNVNIIAGPLNTMSGSSVQYNMYVGRNWNNTGGEAAFNEGTGTVFFNGVGSVPVGNQYITGDETFYNLENAKSGGGNLFFDGDIGISNNFLANGENIVNGPSLDVNNLLLSTGILGLTTGAPNVTVNNFTMGGYLSVTNGNFTCTDITNNGVFGTIDLYNGSVTLNQDASNWPDLNATLNIQGGYMAINGGNMGSFWGFSAPCNITMSNGVLDFNNNGIYMDNTHPLTENITGGTIRTDLNFYTSNVNFTPSGGTIEMYGGTDAYIGVFNNSSLFNLLINKSGGDMDFSFKSQSSEKLSDVTSKSSADDELVYDNSARPTFPLTDSKANTINTASIVKVNGTTTVEEGTFLIDDYTTTCMNNILVNSGGKVAIGDYGTLAIENGKSLTINNGGFLDMTGSAGGAATITHNTGYYALNVESGGTIGAIYGIFEYMNTSGVNIKNGSLVDVLKPFNYCTFRLGQAAGRLMSIENNQTFYVENAIFPANTWGGLYNVSKAVNAGMVYFVTATGGFAGSAFEWDPNNRIFWTGRSLALKAYLEGPFNGATMNTTLNGILPLSHPFNPALPYFGNPSPDWYYTGAGAVGAIPNVNIVDWTLIEIRDAVNAASATPATSVAKFPAFILNNGNIVSLDGASSLQFSNPIVNNLFVVVYNRNHQGIMNANTMSYGSGVYTYDYTTGAAQVFGGAAGHKELVPGKWGMRSGDGNADGNTSILDKTSVWSLTSQLGKTGYLPSDFNFDRQTNNKDKNDKWLPNLGSGSMVP